MTNSAGASTGGSGSGASGGATAGSSGVPSVGGSAASAGAAGAGGSAVAGGSGGASGMGGGAGGVGGSGGSPPYNPCPKTGDPCRVMPLGDSITDSGGSSTGAAYRLELFRLSLMHQKKLTFVGSHQSGPTTVDIDNTPFPRSQEGHSGYTIDDSTGNSPRMGLYPRIVGWLNATPPDIITLMIGTNDIDTQFDLANAPQRLGLLLDRIATTAPSALIVLAQMVPTKDDTENQRVQAYNAAMPALVKARADAGKHVILVDMYGALTQNPDYKTAYMNDNLHPKDAGLAVMANTWYAAIGDLLPAK